MEPQYGYQPAPYNAGGTNTQTINAQWQQRAILGSVVIGLATLAYFVVTGVQMRQSTGVLTINSSDPKAALSIGQDTAAVKQIGTGSATVRLKPGTYQVMASDGASGQSTEVTVTKQKTSTAKLELDTAVPVTTVANYSAQSLYPAADGNLYFLNLLEDMPYVYNLATKAARPYMSNVVNNANITWLSPTRLISESSDGTFTYVNNGEANVITFDDDASPANIISINQEGKLAYVGEETGVHKAVSPTEIAENIGIAWNNSARASVAPDGTILVYTPDDFTGRKDTAQLYAGDTKSDLPEALGGIDHIQRHVCVRHCHSPKHPYNQHDSYQWWQCIMARQQDIAVRLRRRYLEILYGCQKIRQVSCHRRQPRKPAAFCDGRRWQNGLL
jgi:hypothetical protein